MPGQGCPRHKRANLLGKTKVRFGWFYKTSPDVNEFSHRLLNLTIFHSPSHHGFEQVYLDLTFAFTIELIFYTRPNLIKLLGAN